MGDQAAGEFEERFVHVCPSFAVLLPLPPVVVDRLPRWQVMRQQSLSATGPQPVRQRVEDLPPGVSCRPTTGPDGRDQRTEDLPLRIRKIRRVTGTQPAHPSPRKFAATPLPVDLPAYRLFRSLLVQQYQLGSRPPEEFSGGQVSSAVPPGLLPRLLLGEGAHAGAEIVGVACHCGLPRRPVGVGDLVMSAGVVYRRHSVISL